MNIQEKISKWWWNDGHLNENQRDFLISILSDLKPKFVLEIGFASGRSCCTTLITANPTKMISIDLNLDYMGARGHAEAMQNEFKNLKIIEGNSLHLLNDDFFSSEFPNGLDYIFVDGGHEYNEAYSDIENSFKFLSDGGIMIIDDYYSGLPDGCTLVGVNYAVNDFANKNNLEIEKWNMNGKGFAILKK